MADSLVRAMFVCQLDARECQEVTDRRLVSKWAKFNALKISTGPCSVPPLRMTSAGGSSSSGCLEAGSDQMCGLGGVGRGSHFLSLRQRAEESQRGTNSTAAAGARKCRALRFTLSFCVTGVVQTS